MTTQAPLANTALKSFPYDHAQYTEHDFEQSGVGAPHIAASGTSTGNGAYPVFTAGAQGFIYAATVTVTVAGTGAASGITTTLVRANNGANVSNTITIGNTITTGINASGNVFSTGPFTYNLFSNGAVSGSNTAIPGGLFVNVGDTIIMTHTGNTLVCGVTVEYAVAPGASVSA